MALGGGAELPPPLEDYPKPRTFTPPQLHQILCLDIAHAQAVLERARERGVILKTIFPKHSSHTTKVHLKSKGLIVMKASLQLFKSQNAPLSNKLLQLGKLFYNITKWQKTNKLGAKVTQITYKLQIVPHCLDYYTDLPHWSNLHSAVPRDYATTSLYLTSKKEQFRGVMPPPRYI